MILGALTDAQWGMLTTLVAGLGVAWIGGRTQRALARQQHAHDRQMARDDRQQRRREVAYLDLLAMISTVRGRTDALVKQAQAGVVQDFGEVEIDEQALTAVVAFMGPRVRDDVQAWGDCLADLGVAMDRGNEDETIRCAKSLIRRGEQVVNAVRLELGSIDDGGPDSVHNSLRIKAKQREPTTDED